MSRPPYIDIDIDGASLRFHLCENDYICRIEYRLIAQLKDAQMLASDPSGLRRKTPPRTGMQGVDMEKSSHGRAFIAGWESAMKHLDSLCEPGLIEKLAEK